MKQTLITIALIALSMGLCAQTGLLGIHYGQSRADLENTLKSQGFVISATGKDYTYFTNSAIKDLSRVSLKYDYFDKVDSWHIYYQTDNEDEFINNMRDTLSELHGKAIVWDDYIWLLSNDNAVYLQRLSYYTFANVEVCYSDDSDYYMYDDDDWWW